MSNVTDQEADELLTEFVKLRNKCCKSRSKSLQAKYKKQKELCIRKFDYIVKNKAKKYISFSNYDDLLQDGRLALVFALNSFEQNNSKNYKERAKGWFWWANHYVGTKISREANKHSTIKIPLKKTNTIMPYKISQMPVIADSGISAIDSVESIENAEYIHAAISKLPPIQRKVVEMYFEFGTKGPTRTSISKICSDLDISRKECQKILTAAKNSLRSDLEHISI